MTTCVSSSPARLLPALLLAGLSAGVAPIPLLAQQPTASPQAKAGPTAPAAAERERLIAAARQIMAAQKYCAFITVDAEGRPQARTINPFPPEDDMTVWFATSTATRKVREIRDNPRVALYYADHQGGTGYVQLSGRAVLVDDTAEIAKRRRDYWAKAFPGGKNLVLVKVVPERLDVLNYAAGARGDSVTWRTPSVELGPAVPKK